MPAALIADKKVGVATDSRSTSSDVRVDLDATDRYGFVTSAAGEMHPDAEPGARERDTEARRLAKWRKMLGGAQSNLLRKAAALCVQFHFLLSAGSYSSLVFNDGCSHT